MRIDDHPVGVRMVGSAAAAESRQLMDLQLCDPANPTASPTVPLTAGDHVVRSQSGKLTGIDFDRLVLGSDSAGAPMALGDRGSLTDAVRASSPVQGEAPPTVKVTNDGATKVEVQVTGAQPGTPFWLVLGQSQNTGWEATIDGKTPGDSTLVNGYANGWLVNPARANFSVTFDWTPQRQVWIAIWISAAAVLLCIFLALRGYGGGDAPPTRKITSPQAPNRPRSTSMPKVKSRSGTRWWPRAPGRHVPPSSWRRSPPLSSGCSSRAGGSGCSLVSVCSRCCSTGGSGASSRSARPLVFGSVALYIAVSQYRHNFEPKYFWPEYFDRVNDLAWLAVLLLGSDALVEILRTRRWQRDAGAARHGSGSRKHPVTGS